ncbi:MAG: REP-associated tyrosine transposase [Candidatus Acidiferrales bacterium]
MADSAHGGSGQQDRESRDNNRQDVAATGIEAFVRARLQPCRNAKPRRAALAAEVMAIPSRRNDDPGTYFATSRTWQSRRLFVNAELCKMFLGSLMAYREQGHYALHAFVLMPEHFHVLITPAEDVTLERAVQFIKGGSAHRIRQERKLAFPVWQRGFTVHRIRDVGDYETHVQYIEENPVERGLVSSAKEYAWSSAWGGIVLEDVPQLKPLARAAVRHG